MLVWYGIVTALFRCPSSVNDLTESSSYVCKPYLDTRELLTPYVRPYYDSYAAPYLDQARPYVDSFNAQVYTPTLDYGKKNYENYGAPRVDEARVYVQDKWEKIIKPQIDVAQLQARQQYDSNLAPHISKASSAAAPYLTTSRDSASRIYSDYLFPAYESSKPYAENTYANGHKFAVGTGLPYLETAWSSTAGFFNRTLWPKVRILYGENVEPQLVRIGQRLGRYRDGKRLKAAMEDTDGSANPSSISSSITSAASSIAPEQVSPSSAATNSAGTVTSPTASPEQEAEEVREKIESDLKNWEDRFEKAADKGIEDLRERVKEITDRQIKSQVEGVGEALVIQLEEVSATEITNLRKEINYLVQRFPQEYDEDDLEKATFSLSRSTRFAGMAVKEKAQALRSWKETFDTETQSLVSAAMLSTLDVIDNIRDLGLQEIGLRWAQMEGVTYKDWSKYNEVKKTFDEWRSKVQAVAQDHEGLQKSKGASEELESKGMASAEETAKELARLKEVGRWKIEAGDMTDDFSTRYIPAGAAAGARKAKELASSVSEQIVGTSQGTIDAAASDFTEKASNIVSSATSVIVGTEPGAAEQVSSMVNEAVNLGSQKAHEASGKIIGTSTPLHESMISKVTNSASSVASIISDAVSGSSTPVTEIMSSEASSVSSRASSIASQASRKVYGGAMAQKVGEQKPILDDVITDDDDATYSEKLQDMVNQAGERYADITKVVGDALMKATTTQGTVESVTSLADEQYSKALAAASSVLYGAEKGTVESATSVAADKYSQAVAA